MLECNVSKGNGEDGDAAHVVIPADPAAVSPVLEEAAAASNLGTGRHVFYAS